MVVAEWEGHCVSVFSPSGKKLQSFGTYGSGPGREVAVDGEGNILVADIVGIIVFRGSHKKANLISRAAIFLSHCQGRGTGQSCWCYHIVVYVSEWGTCHVSVCTSEGQYVTSFGGRGRV